MTHSSTIAHRYPVLGADRVYAGTRWAVVLIIWAFNAGSAAPVDVWRFPPTQPFGWAFWGYVAFCLFATASVMVRRLSRAVPWLYVGDLLAITGLAFGSQATFGAYESLYFLPFVAIALRFSRRLILLFSIATVGLITLLFLRQSTTDVVEYISRVVMLVALPLLVSILAEQWSQDNRQSVQQAEQQRQSALNQAEGYRDRMQALYEVGFALSTTPHPTHILRVTLSEAARLLPYRVGAILLPTDQRDEIGVAASEHLDGREQQARLAIGQGTLRSLLRGGDGGVLPVEGRQELAALPSFTSCASVLAVPLRSGMRTYGVALFGMDDAQPTEEQYTTLMTLVSYSLVALQNAQLIEELRNERETLLLREEELRRQLNRDLHDGPAQALAAITLNLEFIKRLQRHEPERTQSELDKLAVIARRANHDVRTLLFELRPLVLETQGLLPTIRQYIERFQDQPTQIIVEADDEPLDLAKRVQGTLFNIVQEAVNNALKHAHATHLWIRLQVRPDMVTLTIQDNGDGFDLAAVQRNYDARGSFGLLSIEERARLVNGTADMLSAPGAGTTVKVRVPRERSEFATPPSEAQPELVGS